MTAAESVALVASFVLGVLFVIVAAWPRGGRERAAPREPRSEIYWPLLLGTGEREFDAEMRLRIAVELARRTDDWRIPILLCAREQEDDPRVRDVVERALGPVARPLIAEPPVRTP